VLLRVVQVIGIGRLLADTELTGEQQQYVQLINNSGHLLLTIIKSGNHTDTAQRRNGRHIDSTLKRFNYRDDALLYSIVSATSSISAR
jgi:hypothetical protein